MRKFKWILGCFLSMVLASCGVKSEGSWKLVWADEFNGTNLNPGDWGYDLGGGGWGNGELQAYSADPMFSFVSNGMLTIRATSKPYMSARINTRGKRSFLYGRIAARIKLPYGKGIWPAFWMLGASIDKEVIWPECGEIDIMEMIGGGDHRDDQVYGTIHWADADGRHQYVGYGTVNGHGFELPDPQFFYQDFHEFEAEWDKTRIVWKLDGQPYFEQTITNADQSEFHEPFFIILNVAIGGKFPGYPSSSQTVFPQEMQVDWVRVYQREN